MEMNINNDPTRNEKTITKELSRKTPDNTNKIIPSTNKNLVEFGLTIFLLDNFTV